MYHEKPISRFKLQVLGILLAVGLLLFGYAKRASGTPERIEVEPTPHPSEITRLASVGATQTFAEETTQPSPEPTKEPTPTPTPVIHEVVSEPTPAPRLALKPTVAPVVKPRAKPKSSVLRVNCANNPTAAGCCVDVLKVNGDLPDAKVTKDGFARSIPSEKIKEFKPGEEMVIKTKESSMGHVLKVKINEKGQAVSIKEGGHPEGEGRIVDPKVIVGEVKL